MRWDIGRFTAGIHSANITIIQRLGLNEILLKFLFISKNVSNASLFKARFYEFCGFGSDLVCFICLWD